MNRTRPDTPQTGSVSQVAASSGQEPQDGSGWRICRKQLPNFHASYSVIRLLSAAFFSFQHGSCCLLHRRRIAAILWRGWTDCNISPGPPEDSKTIKALLFDTCGTVFDVHSVQGRCDERVPRSW